MAIRRIAARGIFIYVAIIAVVLLVIKFAHADEIRPLQPLTGINAAMDRQDELQHLLDLAGKTKQSVYLPAGIYRHSGMLNINGIVVTGEGAKTVLEGTTRDQTAVVVKGKDAQLSNIKLTYKSTTRSLDVKSSEVLVDGAEDFTINNLIIDGGDCAGILLQHAHHGVIANNDIRNTLADSIHITGGSSNIIVHDNTTHYSGDDGVAVVSYEADQAQVHDVVAYKNTIIDNKFARGMSVVGGHDINYHDNYIQCAGQWAGIYIASEKVFETFGDSNVTIVRNTVKNCGGPETGHGAVMIFSDYNKNVGITLRDNMIIDAKGWGIHVLGASNSGLSIQGNTIQNAKDKAFLIEPGVPPVDIIHNNVVK